MKKHWNANPVSTFSNKIASSLVHCWGLQFFRRDLERMVKMRHKGALCRAFNNTYRLFQGNLLPWSESPRRLWCNGWRLLLSSRKGVVQTSHTIVPSVPHHTVDIVFDLAPLRTKFYSSHKRLDVAHHSLHCSHKQDILADKSIRPITHLLSLTTSA